MHIKFKTDCAQCTQSLKRSSCERDAQVWQRRMGFISRWASRPAPVNPAWFTGLQCGNPWFIGAEWRAREWCASNPGPWAVSTLLQLFGYYHSYFGAVVNLLWYMRISVLTAAALASLVVNDWTNHRCVYLIWFKYYLLIVITSNGLHDYSEVKLKQNYKTKFIDARLFISILRLSFTPVNTHPTET